MSEFNKDPIDIVVPWVNSEDPVWQKDFLYWSKIETGNTDRCRIRDLGNIKYLFRSIDTNCPWVRNVYLILYGESQIPTWLNKDYTKLKIIYHRDFIPEKFLPTFNSFIYGMYYHKIPGISNNFIYCNDDMLFLSGLKETDFFNNDRPQFPFEYLFQGVYKWRSTKFDYTMANVFKKIKQITGINFNTRVYHMPIPLQKNIYEFMWHKYSAEFETAMDGSKFRQGKNYFEMLFFFMQQILNIADNHNIKRNFINLSDETTAKNISDVVNAKGLGCVNDCECLKNREKSVQKIMLTCLEKRFPKKSIFEV